MHNISLQTIYAAAHRIQGHVRQTPLWESSRLGNVHLKMELLQPTGSFKIRGVANKLRSLSLAERARGVCTFSTGNHGLALSYLAGQLGIRSIICVSDHVPKQKLDAICRAGGELLFCGAGQDQAKMRCEDLADQQGMTLVPPFDDLDIIAGQGTIGLEILECLPETQTLIIPLSGGGLLSGIAFAAKHINPQIRIVGVTMDHSAAMYESLRAGHPVAVEETATLADSLLGGIGFDNRYTFQMTQLYLDDLVLVSEEEIAHGIAYLLEEHHVVAEGAGAVGIAAMMAGKIGHVEHGVAVISGGNIGLNTILKIVTEVKGE